VLGRFAGPGTLLVLCCIRLIKKKNFQTGHIKKAKGGPASRSKEGNQHNSNKKNRKRKLANSA
jgi:hypothetical protein